VLQEMREAVKSGLEYQKYGLAGDDLRDIIAMECYKVALTGKRLREGARRGTGTARRNGEPKTAE
jgi:hypothetical protein